MDFETVNQGVPIIKGTRAYYQLPFQWSVHKWDRVDKEIENKECSECSSSFRLVYNLDDTSGYPKFCCFCGCEMYDNEDVQVEEEDS